GPDRSGAELRPPFGRAGRGLPADEGRPALSVQQTLRCRPSAGVCPRPQGGAGRNHRQRQRPENVRDGLFNERRTPARHRRRVGGGQRRLAERVGPAQPRHFARLGERGGRTAGRRRREDPLL
ncbi:MAG: hypothetical protein AVDCRST_MAG19-347, partial [uncultured Thermomicrobiales bacterium]